MAANNQKIYVNLASNTLIDLLDNGCNARFGSNVTLATLKKNILFIVN